MAFVEVDVDIDDISIHDLASYIKRLKARHDKSKFNQIKAAVGRISKDAGDDGQSKVDQWKNELWPAIRDKYSLEQLEALINH